MMHGNCYRPRYVTPLDEKKVEFTLYTAFSDRESSLPFYLNLLFHVIFLVCG